MRFTFDETAHLIAALETYNDMPRGYYGKRLQNELVNSALAKLNAKANVDSFSQRECAVMFLATSLVLSEFDSGDYIISDQMRDLCFFLKTHAAGELEIVPLD